MYIRQRRLDLSALLLVSALLSLTACGTMQVGAEPMPLQDDQPPVELIQGEPTGIPAEQVPSMDVHTPEDVQQYDETPVTTVDSLLEFEAQLMQAVETHDFDLMQSLMGEPFGLAGWRSEGWAYTPDEAIEQFRVNYLGADNTIRFQDAPDLSQQLNGRDVLSVWDPKGCSVLDQQSELASRIAVKQAMLGQTAIQPRLFQAGAALHGEN